MNHGWQRRPVILPADGDSIRGSGGERSISAAQSCNVHALAEKAKLGNEFMSALKRCEVALDCKGRRGLLAVRRLEE